MKKTNIVVAIIVSIVCVISGIFIFMPNNNTAFESYYKEIKRVDEYQEVSDYLNITAVRNEKYVDFTFTSKGEKLNDIEIVIIPDDASLRFSKPFLSVGVLETQKINLVKEEDLQANQVEQIWVDGLAASMKNNEDEYLIYFSFRKENNTIVKEYLKVEVED